MMINSTELKDKLEEDENFWAWKYKVLLMQKSMTWKTMSKEKLHIRREMRTNLSIRRTWSKPRGLFPSPSKTI